MTSSPAPPVFSTPTTDSGRLKKPVQRYGAMVSSDEDESVSWDDSDEEEKPKKKPKVVKVVKVVQVEKAKAKVTAKTVVKSKRPAVKTEPPHKGVAAKATKPGKPSAPTAVKKAIVPLATKKVAKKIELKKAPVKNTAKRKHSESKVGPRGKGSDAPLPHSKPKSTAFAFQAPREIIHLSEYTNPFVWTGALSEAKSKGPIALGPARQDKAARGLSTSGPAAKRTTASASLLRADSKKTKSLSSDIDEQRQETPTPGIASSSGECEPKQPDHKPKPSLEKGGAQPAELSTSVASNAECEEGEQDQNSTIRPLASQKVSYSHALQISEDAIAQIPVGCFDAYGSYPGDMTPPPLPELPRSHSTSTSGSLVKVRPSAESGETSECSQPVLKKKLAPAEKVTVPYRLAIMDALTDPKYLKTLDFKSVSPADSAKLSRHWREVLSADLKAAFGGTGAKAPRGGKSAIDQAMRLRIWKHVCDGYDKADWQGALERGQVGDESGATSLTTSKLKRHFRDVMRKEGDKVIAK